MRTLLPARSAECSVILHQQKSSNPSSAADSFDVPLRLRHRFAMLANMILGVISDTHGRVDNILTALAHFRERRVELIIHCGDIDTEDSVAAFTGWPVHFVFGNCDWNREAIRSAIAAIGGTLHEPY